MTKKKRSLLDKLFDAVAEPSVVLSYSTIGYKARAHRFVELACDLQGHHIVVTGANAGIGRAATEKLATLGATVTMVCRSQERGEQARTEIMASTGSNALSLRLCDMASMQEVNALCDTFLSEGKPIDRLVLNAGILPDTQRITDEGLDETFAVNLLSGFILTQRLRPLLAKAEHPPGRIINVTSGGMYSQRLDLELLQGRTDKFDGVVAYAQTKRAQVILTELWGERLAADGVQCHTMHPGWADTAGVQKSLPRFHKILGPMLRDPAEGADTMVWLCATDDELGTGKLWLDREVRKTHMMSRTKSTAEEREGLFTLCEELCDRFHVRFADADPASRAAS